MIDETLITEKLSATANTLTKKDLAEQLHFQLGWSKAEALEFVDDFFTELTASLIDNGELKIRNFASFKIKQKSARIGRNPKTAEPKEISARKTVSMTIARNFREELNHDI